MGKLFYLPCRDYYDEYEDYYGEDEEEFKEDYYLSNDIQDYRNENWFRNFVRKVLLFILNRL